MSTDVPSMLSGADLERVPGVLGRIALERAAAYEAQAASQPPVDAAPNAGRFAAALAAPGLAFITEIKRGSPSQGAIADLDPVLAAQQYAEGGANALSVLTEPIHFGGELPHLRSAVRAVQLPAMRKDFVVHPSMVQEAAEAGAAAVLLIVAVLGDALKAYLAYAAAWGLDALVEVHDEAELEVALEAGASLVGVNNRDLTTLDVDLRVAPRVLAAARDAGFEGTLVAESGYRTASDLAGVLGLADAVLVGTSLAGSGDLTGALTTLVEDVRKAERDRGAG